MIENLKKFERIKMEIIANFTFLKKSTFQVFNHKVWVKKNWKGVVFSTFFNFFNRI